MRCCYCNKNEAVRSYVSMKNGQPTKAFYCLACYEKLFLCVKETEGESSLSVCPYCGTTIEEFFSSQLVGCPHCYQALESSIHAGIVQMQNGLCGHRGKTPSLSEEGETRLNKESFSTKEELDLLHTKLIKLEKFNKQKKELEILIKHLGGINQKREREYKEKLQRMLATGEGGDEIVW